MKTALLIALLFALPQAHAVDFLTKNEAAKVLQAIDNICADTWCEGDFNYSFNELLCEREKNSCIFSFEFINEIYDEETFEMIKEERLGAACELLGFNKYEEMLDKDGELTREFYESVNDCIGNEIENAYEEFDL